MSSNFRSSGRGRDLVSRRRARTMPLIFAGVAAAILLGGVLLTIFFFTSETGQALFRTATPTPTITLTPVPPSLTPVPTDTPQFTATPTATAGPSPTPTQVTYVVQEFDTLFGIAAQFQIDVTLLMQVNNLTVNDSLSVGKTLIIPSGDFPTITPSPLPSNLPRGAKIQYVVLLGDTLEAIATKFNSTVDDIVRNNKNVSNATLQAGQTLTVRINLVTAVPTSTPTAAP